MGNGMSMPVSGLTADFCEDWSPTVVMNRLGYLSAAWFTISHDENFGWAPNQTPERGDKSRNALRVPKNMFGTCLSNQQGYSNSGSKVCLEHSGWRMYEMKFLIR